MKRVNLRNCFWSTPESISLSSLMEWVFYLQFSIYLRCKEWCIIEDITNSLLVSRYSRRAELEGLSLPSLHNLWKVQQKIKWRAPSGPLRWHTLIVFWPITIQHRSPNGPMTDQSKVRSTRTCRLKFALKIRAFPSQVDQWEASVCLTGGPMSVRPVNCLPAGGRERDSPEGKQQTCQKREKRRGREFSASTHPAWLHCAASSTRGKR